jgi:hypothetical protein
LTIKLTRPTAALAPAHFSNPSCFQQELSFGRNTVFEKHGANSTDLHFCRSLVFRNHHHTPRKSYEPLNSLLITRPALSRLASQQVFHFLGTHKNLQPCRLPNLFSCQTSSS